MKVGILAVQGAFIEHEKILETMGIEYVELRKKSDIENNELCALIFPGGESTVQGKLLKELDMFDSIKKLIEQNIPVLATCAGMILLSKHISDDDTVHLGTLPVTVKRNAYGRQLGSFVAESEFRGIGQFEMTFIRAPYVEKVESDDVQILACVDDKIVAVRYKNQLALSFHPELGKDIRLHKYFLDMIK